MKRQEKFLRNMQTARQWNRNTRVHSTMVSGTNVVNLSRENQERYEGKVIEITARVLKPKSFPSKFFMPGRMAMTCCADDIAYIGVMCKSDFVDKLELRQWITVTAKVEKEYVKQYQGEGPVLYPVSIEPGKKPEGDDLVYFN